MHIFCNICVMGTMRNREFCKMPGQFANCFRRFANFPGNFANSPGDFANFPGIFRLAVEMKNPIHIHGISVDISIDIHGYILNICVYKNF